MVGWATLALINAAKGKWWTALLICGYGWFTIGTITAIRVAKPGSLWDRKWSSPDKQARSRVRFRMKDRFPVQR